MEEEKKLSKHQKRMLRKESKAEKAKKERIVRGTLLALILVTVFLGYLHSINDGDVLEVDQQVAASNEGLTVYDVERQLLENQAQEPTSTNRTMIVSPDGTRFYFQTTNFSGEFYPEQIKEIMSAICVEPLQADVVIEITDALAYQQLPDGRSVPSDTGFWGQLLGL